MQENNKKSIDIIKQETNEDDENDESDSESKQSPRFMNFVNSYSRFINDQHNTQLDMNQVLSKLNQDIKSNKPQYNHLEDFQKFLEINPQQINELAQQLKQLPDFKQYQCIQIIEKINFQLEQEQDEEFEYAKSKGLI